MHDLYVLFRFQNAAKWKKYKVLKITVSIFCSVSKYIPILYTGLVPKVLKMRIVCIIRSAVFTVNMHVQYLKLSISVSYKQMFLVCSLFLYTFIFLIL